MKRQRVYIDRPQTSELKNQISANYITNIAPYELLVESINLQNKQIYELQQKYLQLLSETENAKTQQSFTEKEKQILKDRQELKIQERKKFVQQGLKANSMKYHEEFQKKEKSLLEVRDNKQQMLKDMKARQLNVFFRLQEKILDQLIDFGMKENTNKDENIMKSIQEIKWWQKRYEIEMDKDNSKQINS